MESCPRLSLLLSCALLLLAPGACGQELPADLEPRALRFYSSLENASQEKELIEALQEVLEKLKSKRIPTYEKKYGQVPMNWTLRFVAAIKHLRAHTGMEAKILTYTRKACVNSMVLMCCLKASKLI